MFCRAKRELLTILNSLGREGVFVIFPIELGIDIQSLSNKLHEQMKAFKFYAWKTSYEGKFLMKLKGNSLSDYALPLHGSFTLRLCLDGKKWRKKKGKDLKGWRSPCLDI